MMTQHSFEQVRFNIIDLLETEHGEISDPDSSCFNELVNFDTQYYFSEDVRDAFATNINTSTFPIFHLNIRSLRRNFEDFKVLINELQVPFKLICLTETWLADNDLVENSNYKIDGYTAIHLERKEKIGGGVLIYVKNNVNFKSRPDLTISNKNVEFLTIEILNENSKNFLVSCHYRPPKGDVSALTKQIEKVHRDSNLKKPIFIIGDYNLNCFEYDSKPIITIAGK